MDPEVRLDAPDDVSEHLRGIALALCVRWLLAPAQAAVLVERWVDGEDLHGESNWVYLHEEPEYWAGVLFHRFVLHDGGACPEECGADWRDVRLPGPRGVAPNAVLLLGMPSTSTAELLAEAAARRGLEVRRVTGPGDLAGVAGRAAYWHGGPLAAGRVIGRAGIGLLEPDDGWLPRIGRRFTGRSIDSATLSEAWALTGPAFVKPPSAKSFPARVYRDGPHLSQSTGDLAPDTPVLVSEVVTLTAEYRFFLLDGDIVAASRYAVDGRLDVAMLEGDPREREARAFARALIGRWRYWLPSAVVVDVALARDADTGRERWVVVEANMAWFAHCYAADPDRVLDVVLRSAGPLKDVAARDFEFLHARS